MGAPGLLGFLINRGRVVMAIPVLPVMVLTSRGPAAALVKTVGILVVPIRLIRVARVLGAG